MASVKLVGAVPPWLATKTKRPRFSRGLRLNGSGSWIRTSDQVVNSHLLYR